MMTVLYVQDDRDQAVGDVNNLTDFGGARFDVVVAATVEEARKKLVDHTFDLLLVDYHLGENESVGLELLLEVPPESEATKVLFSARTEAEVRMDWGRPFPAGVQFWEKGTLWSRLRTWVRNKTRTCTLDPTGQCLWSTLPPTVELPNPPFYYVAFPYDEETVDLESSWYQDTLEQKVEAPYRARAEITLHGTHRDSLEHCLHAVRRAKAVIADLRDDRPTVMMEIGFALALCRNVLLLQPHGHDLPHYLKRQPALTYRAPTPREDGKLLTQINEWLKKRH